MNIVVLSGGLSRERDVSLCTGSMVTKALLEKGHNAVQLDVIQDYDVADNNYKKYIETCRDRDGLELYVSKQTPDIESLRVKIDKAGKGVFGKNVLSICMASDIVFMALHGEDGEDGKIQATFDMLRIKYTGAGYLGSAVAMSKCFSKKVFVTSDIPTPEYIQLSKDGFDDDCLDDVKLPCVVKLSSSGSSIGIYIVNERAELKETVKDAFEIESNLIVEQFIKGREFTCGILDGKALPLVEIIPNEGFYDYEHKYQAGATLEICPAELDTVNTKRIQEVALKAHKALDLDIYSRSDFILDKDDNIFCLETNTLPGMTPTSLIPQQAAAVGIDYNDLCELLIELSLKKILKEFYMQPISINEIINACGGTGFGCDGIIKSTTTNIRIDSRKVEPGDVFIAVKGENLDGHDYIDGAFKREALAIITEKPCEGMPYILVESTFKALKEIAEYYRSKFDIKVIGITGSVGKTTAKEMMACVLSEKYNVLKTQGNLNNEFGLPQMIFRIEPKHNIAILEMGMNHFGEISRLSKTARPDIAVIINIGESHIGNLGSRDGILKAKCEIFDYLKEDGIVILNGDDDKLITLKSSKWNPLFFGEAEHNDFYVKEIKSMDENGTKFTACYDESTLELNVASLGKHMIYPTLAAAFVAKKLGLNDDEIINGVNSFKNIGSRNRIINTENLTILDDVYNACEESIVAGTKALELIKTGNKRIAIIGDVFEVGDYAEKIHYDIGTKVCKQNIDLFICVGKDASHIHDGIVQNSNKKSLYFETQDNMLEELGNIVEKGDAIYVKASRGMKLEKTVEFLKQI